MADIYAVKFNNSGTVTIPNCSLSGTYTLKLRFKTHTTLTTDALIGSSAETGGSPTNFVAVYTAGEMKIRLNGTVVYTSAQALFQANKKYSITITVTSGAASITAVNETDSATIINAASATMSTAFTFDRIGGGGASSALALTGEIAEVETTNSSDNRRYISTVNTGSVWSETVGAKNGTLNGLPTDGTQWVFYEAAAVDPAPTGEVTLGTPTDVTSNSATIPYFYSENDQTGFEYRLNGGSAFSVTSSPLLLTGLAASTAYSVEVRAVNGTTPGDWSAAANFTTLAAGSAPSGAFTVGTITTTQTTASAPYTYSAADQTSIEYRIDAGAAVTASVSPQSLSGLTAGTTYGIQFRAVNGFGNGAWSTSAPFTTAAVPVGTITLTGLANNTATLWSNLSGISCTVMNEAATIVVVTKTGLTANAGGSVTFNDAAITAGTWCTVVIVSGTNRGIVRIQAT